MTLRTLKLVPFFTALSRDKSGKAILYDGSLEGELVEVSILRERSDHAIAALERVIEPSEWRREPACPNFGICGGCDLLHMARGKEAEEKERIFRHFFSGFSSAEFLQPVFPDRQGSRIRASFQCDGVSKGFFRRSSRKVVDIGSCPLLDPSLNEALANLPIARSAKALGRSAAGEPACASMMASDKVKVGRFMYHVGNGVFFQSNAQCAAALLDFVVNSAKGASLAIDLYAGIGFFSKALEMSVDKVVAVEENPACLEWSRRNLDRTEFHSMRVEDAAYVLDRANPDLVVTDPPRSGMSRKALDLMLRLGPKRIVYVSCAIDKSIGDIERIAAAGYELTRAQLLDMAPATRRIETVCLLEKRPNSAAVAYGEPARRPKFS